MKKELIFDGFSDEMLVEEYRRSASQLAFYALYKRYETMIGRMGRSAERKTGGRVTADDMISQINERFVESVKSYDPSRGVMFGSYVFMRNVGARSKAVRASRRQKRSINYGAMYIEEHKNGFDDFIGYIIDFDPISEQLDFLRTVSPELAHIAMMRVDGYTFEDIGRAIGVSGKGAKLRMAVNRRVDNVRTHLRSFYMKRNPHALKGYKLS